MTAPATPAPAQTPAALAARYGLPRLGGRPALPRYLRLLWARRHFTLELARSRFQAETSADRLGLAWVVIRPLINAVVYGLIFGLLLPASTRPENFVAFLVTGIFVFQFFAACLSDGAKAIYGNLGLVRALHFPRAVLPIATVAQEVFALGPMMGVLAVLVVATGEPPRPSWLLVPAALALATMFNLGVAFVAARLTIHIRDITQLIPFLTRVVFYLSGIFFAVDRVTDNPVLLALLQGNPVHIYIELVRDGFIAEHSAPGWMWAAGAGYGVGALLVGFLFFYLAEERYGRA